MDARLAEREHGRSAGSRAPGASTRQSNPSIALAAVSLGVSIPLTAIAASTAGLLAVIIVWLGIVGVNWIYATGGR